MSAPDATPTAPQVEAPRPTPRLSDTPRHLEHLVTDEWVAAGADLSAIRGLVCRMLRRGAPLWELHSVLKAEERAMDRLARALDRARQEQEVTP